MRSKIKEIIAGKAGKIYPELLDGIDDYITPHTFIDTAYALYQESFPNNSSINGRIFEWLICETLKRENVTPFYYQARVRLVPNADFDILCFNSHKPVALSCKVSLRERYKQADLEGWALKQVYRQANNYLLTLDKEECERVTKKISTGDISGLTACVVANTDSYTKLIRELQNRSFFEAEPLSPLQKGTLIPVSRI